MTDKSLSLADFLKEAGIDKIGEFKPGAFVNKPLSMFIYLEQDVSYTSKPIKGSNIWLLYSNKKGERRKLVGVRIDGISKVGGLEQEPLPRDTSRFRRLSPRPKRAALVPASEQVPFEAVVASHLQIAPATPTTTRQLRKKHRTNPNGTKGL
jgi:hypothetical protein